AVLDPDDRCPTLAYIANTVAKNRTIREIYEHEADNKGCKPPAARVRPSVGLSHAMTPIAAADSGESSQDIRAIYVYRQKSDRAAAELADEVMQKLNGLGYNIPGQNDVDTKLAQNEIRFFNKRDEAAATKVQSQLVEAIGKRFVVT